VMLFVAGKVRDERTSIEKDAVTFVHNLTGGPGWRQGL
jgi:hypothetical protein